MSTQPLTPAEQLAAEAIGGEFECTWHVGCDEECHADRARAVVAAARHLIEADVLDVAAEDLEQMADQIRRTHTAAQPNRPGLEIAASVLRGRAAAFRQSTTTPEGHQR